MGRRAGVTAEQTRKELLDAAARVFARKGYDGASINDLAVEAGVSSGTIYSHFESKAALFVSAVQEHAQQEAAELVGLRDVAELATAPVTEQGMLSFVTTVVVSLARPEPRDDALLLEAIVAAKRHPEVAELIASWLAEGEVLVAQAVRQGQQVGLVDPTLDAAVAARFVTFLSLGARLTNGLDVPPVDVDAWTSFLMQLLAAVRLSAPAAADA